MDYIFQLGIREKVKTSATNLFDRAFLFSGLFIWINPTPGGEWGKIIPSRSPVSFVIEH